MSFFDERVEAYRHKVGTAQAEVDAARERDKFKGSEGE